mmetsp:Transcript_27009/g.55657  ORF Transcript_27009/g.55657 Transcript_27009/m.55657 type:complete len:206 (-) Transcript_27009:948-1565(-)
MSEPAIAKNGTKSTEVIHRLLPVSTTKIARNNTDPPTRYWPWPNASMTPVSSATPTASSDPMIPTTGRNYVGLRRRERNREGPCPGSVILLRKQMKTGMRPTPKAISVVGMVNTALEATGNGVEAEIGGSKRRRPVKRGGFTWKRSRRRDGKRRKRKKRMRRKKCSPLQMVKMVQVEAGVEVSTNRVSDRETMKKIVLMEHRIKN